MHVILFKIIASKSGVQFKRQARKDDCFSVKMSRSSVLPFSMKSFSLCTVFACIRGYHTEADSRPQECMNLYSTENALRLYSSVECGYVTHIRKVLADV